ncbi:protein phosphatase 1 regulatory subunit 12C [Brienomyrus brachyistius]|uniref:protein phosphatase 1 regulatory subunit 12C n=1 Tax=Brienomyrus brachyistius TaxID=42636 RepID=UPI0020B20DDB|nr:protein phosphatase 1 regulatory subunit 12C [Brienomyrus brachyistius]
MADAAKSKRREQLKRWAGSMTDREPAVPRQRWRGDAWEAGEPKARQPTETEPVCQLGLGGRTGTEGDRADSTVGRRRRVRFERTAEFLAACASGDTEEAIEMLRDIGEKKDDPEEGSGGIVNSTNADGITALHQACIDGSMEMVVFLLEHSASVNQADNEGWTPLHVAASCGNLEITDFLLQNGADVCKVNCDGDVPLDIAENEDTEALLREHTLQRGIDVATVKREEEEHLMRDARTWLSEGLPSDLRHPKTGATPLHVAAAKGYIEVIKLLCHCGIDVSLTDTDGWTAFHAAAHWGQGEACRILAEHLCNMEARSNAGQTPFDIADESMKTLLEELSQKQAHWRNEQSVNERQNVVEPAAANTSSKNRRSSVCRMSSREKMNVQDQSKEKGVPGGLELREDERESSPENSTLSSPESEKTVPPTVTVSKTCEEENERKEKERENRTARVQPTLQRTASSTSESSSTGNTDKRKFQTSMRDEESESQRKARSRLLRQSRRSTQGVTLTDLKEAEKTIGKSSDIPRSIQAVSPVVTVTPAERDIEPAKNSPEDGEKFSRLGVKERRKGRKERRFTGVLQAHSGEMEDTDQMDDSLTDSSSSHSEPQPEDYTNISTSPDYKVLFHKVLKDNELLREKLQETELQLNQNKVDLERLRQNQEQSSDRPALLELERYEKKALEIKAMELEDELKILTDLRADNQRLKDENAALIRVISKLSK